MSEWSDLADKIRASESKPKSKWAALADKIRTDEKPTDTPPPEPSLDPTGPRMPYEHDDDLGAITRPKLAPMNLPKFDGPERSAVGAFPGESSVTVPETGGKSVDWTGMGLPGDEHKPFVQAEGADLFGHKMRDPNAPETERERLAKQGIMDDLATALGAIPKVIERGLAETPPGAVAATTFNMIADQQGMTEADLMKMGRSPWSDDRWGEGSDKPARWGEGVAFGKLVQSYEDWFQKPAIQSVVRVANKLGADIGPELDPLTKSMVASGEMTQDDANNLRSFMYAKDAPEWLLIVSDIDIVTGVSRSLAKLGMKGAKTLSKPALRGLKEANEYLKMAAKSFDPKAVVKDVGDSLDPIKGFVKGQRMPAPKPNVVTRQGRDISIRPRSQPHADPTGMGRRGAVGERGGAWEIADEITKQRLADAAGDLRAASEARRAASPVARGARRAERMAGREGPQRLGQGDAQPIARPAEPVTDPTIDLTEGRRTVDEVFDAKTDAELAAVKKKVEARRPATEKQPWEMTRIEYAAEAGRKRPGITARESAMAGQKAANEHLGDVERAVREGKPVPERVLKEYGIEPKPAATGEQKPYTGPERRKAPDAVEQLGAIEPTPIDRTKIPENVKDAVRRAREAEKYGRRADDYTLAETGEGTVKEVLPGGKKTPEVKKPAPSVHDEPPALTDDELHKILKGDIPDERYGAYLEDQLRDSADATARSLEVEMSVLPGKGYIYNQKTHTWHKLTHKLRESIESATKKPRPAAPETPLWEKSVEELDDAIRGGREADASIEVEIFGKEGAKKYKTAYARANNAMNPERADKAQKIVDEMEAALTDAQRNRFFGIDDPSVVDVDELKLFAEVRSLAREDPEIAIARAMRELRGETDPTKMSFSQTVEYAGLQEAREQIAKQGLDEVQIVRDAIKREAARHSDPADAEFMLKPYMDRAQAAAKARGGVAATRPPPKAIAAPVTPAPTGRQHEVLYLPAPYRKAGQIEVIKNPTPAEIAQLKKAAKKSPHGTGNLRTVVLDGDEYVWRAELGIHDDITKQLRARQTARTVEVKDPALKAAGYEDAVVPAAKRNILDEAAGMSKEEFTKRFGIHATDDAAAFLPENRLMEITRVGTHRFFRGKESVIVQRRGGKAISGEDYVAALDGGDAVVVARDPETVRAFEQGHEAVRALAKKRQTGIEAGGSAVPARAAPATGRRVPREFVPSGNVAAHDYNPGTQWVDSGGNAYAVDDHFASAAKVAGGDDPKRGMLAEGWVRVTEGKGTVVVEAENLKRSKQIVEDIQISAEAKGSAVEIWQNPSKGPKRLTYSTSDETLFNPPPKRQTGIEAGGRAVPARTAPAASSPPTSATVRLPSQKGGFVEVPAVYIRMGLPPTDKAGNVIRSGVYYPTPTGGKKKVGEEAGVSVLQAWHDPKTGKYVIYEGGEELASSIHNSDRPMFQVTGRELRETGSDLEPLLDPGTVRVTKKLTLDDFVTDQDPWLTLGGTELKPHQIPNWENAGGGAVPRSRQGSVPTAGKRPPLEEIGDAPSPAKPARKQPWEQTTEEFLREKYDAANPETWVTVDGMAQVQRKIYADIGERLGKEIGVSLAGRKELSAADLVKVSQHYSKKLGVPISINDVPSHLRARGAGIPDYYAQRGRVPVGGGPRSVYAGETHPGWTDGWEIVAHRGKLKLSRAEELGVLRHEIEHIKDLLDDFEGAFSGKTVKLADLPQGVMRQLEGVHKGHHKNYRAFEAEYLHRKEVRDAIKRGDPVPPEVLAEHGIDSAGKRVERPKAPAAKPDLPALKKKKGGVANYEKARTALADHPELVDELDRIVHVREVLDYVKSGRIDARSYLGGMMTKKQAAEELGVPISYLGTKKDPGITLDLVASRISELDPAFRSSVELAGRGDELAVKWLKENASTEPLPKAIGRLKREASEKAMREIEEESARQADHIESLERELADAAQKGNPAAEGPPKQSNEWLEEYGAAEEARIAEQGDLDAAIAREAEALKNGTELQADIFGNKRLVNEIGGETGELLPGAATKVDDATPTADLPGQTKMFDEPAEPLSLTQRAERALKDLTPYDPEFDEILEAVRERARGYEAKGMSGSDEWKELTRWEALLEDRKEMGGGALRDFLNPLAVAKQIPKRVRDAFGKTIERGKKVSASMRAAARQEAEIAEEAARLRDSATGGERQRAVALEIKRRGYEKKIGGKTAGEVAKDNIRRAARAVTGKRFISDLTKDELNGINRLLDMHTADDIVAREISDEARTLISRVFDDPPVGPGTPRLVSGEGGPPSDFMSGTASWLTAQLRPVRHVFARLEEKSGAPLYTKFWRPTFESHLNMSDFKGAWADASRPIFAGLRKAEMRYLTYALEGRRMKNKEIPRSILKDKIDVKVWNARKGVHEQKKMTRVEALRRWYDDLRGMFNAAVDDQLAAIGGALENASDPITKRELKKQLIAWKQKRMGRIQNYSPRISDLPSRRPGRVQTIAKAKDWWRGRMKRLDERMKKAVSDGDTERIASLESQRGQLQGLIDEQFPNGDAGFLVIDHAGNVLMPHGTNRANAAAFGNKADAESFLAALDIDEAQVLGRDLRFFASEKRTGALEPRLLPANEIADIYLRGASRVMFMQPVWDSIQPLRATLSRNVKKFVDNYGRRAIFGRPHQGIFSKDFLSNISPRTARNVETFGRALIDMTYTNLLGFNPGSAIKNLTQSAHTYAELGERWTAYAVKHMPLWDAESKAKIKQSHIHREFAPSLKFDESVHLGLMAKVRFGAMWMFQRADKFNRTLAYIGMDGKTRHYLAKLMDQKTKYGIDNFFKDTGLGRKKNLLRKEVEDILAGNFSRKAKEDKVSHLLAQDLVGRTQYLYGVTDAPMAFRSMGGRFFGQFMSWPLNYSELLVNWGKNKKFTAFARHLIALNVLAEGVDAAGGDISSWFFDRDLPAPLSWLPIQPLKGPFESGVGGPPGRAMAQIPAAALRGDWEDVGSEAKRLGRTMVPLANVGRRAVNLQRDVRGDNTPPNIVEKAYGARPYRSDAGTEKKWGARLEKALPEALGVDRSRKEPPFRDLVKMRVKGKIDHDEFLERTTRLVRQKRDIAAAVELYDEYKDLEREFDFKGKEIPPYSAFLKSKRGNQKMKSLGISNLEYNNAFEAAMKELDPEDREEVLTRLKAEVKAWKAEKKAKKSGEKP